MSSGLNEPSIQNLQKYTFISNVCVCVFDVRHEMSCSRFESILNSMLISRLILLYKNKYVGWFKQPIYIYDIRWLISNDLA